MEIQGQLAPCGRVDAAGAVFEPPRSVHEEGGETPRIINARHWRGATEGDGLLSGAICRLLPCSPVLIQKDQSEG
jgi:hypothetical protein